MNPLFLLLLGLLIVLGGILLFRLHPVLALLLGAVVVGGLTGEVQLRAYAQSQDWSAIQIDGFLDQTLGKRITLAFGRTCEKIGLLILMASIIGKCLLESGAAERIVRSIVGVFGERRSPLAFTLSSFVLAIPMFFDTVFYLMIPLARAMGVRREKMYPLLIMAIVAGGTIAHSLVPPTPGPLFAADALGVSIGLMLIVGIVVGLVASVTGLGYAYWLNKRQDIPLRDTSDTSVADLRVWLEKDRKELPSFLLAHVPIALPVVLIAGHTITNEFPDVFPNYIVDLFAAVGEPVMALLIAGLAALLLLARQSKFDKKRIQNALQGAVQSAGVIILITACGGAFGAILQQTAISEELASLAPNFQLAILPLAWLITAVIRTAQGSATVSIITAVGMMAAFNDPAVLGFHPVYLAVAIGCGSKPFPWMNDSGFWIVCKMSGFTEGETIRNFSVLLTLMGLTGLIVTMILTQVFPML
ncbi:MAG: GntP family permease [Saprospiraceae bacterium]|nr:GntP family permease [Lewinella sp.]